MQGLRKQLTTAALAAALLVTPALATSAKAGVILNDRQGVIHTEKNGVITGDRNGVIQTDKAGVIVGGKTADESIISTWLAWLSGIVHGG